MWCMHVRGWKRRRHYLVATAIDILAWAVTDRIGIRDTGVSAGEEVSFLPEQTKRNCRVEI